MWPFKNSQAQQFVTSDYTSTSLYEIVLPWLNMLKMYRSMGRKAEFVVVAHRLHDDFNLEMIPWQTGEAADAAERMTLEDFPHIMENLLATWGRRECLTYINELLEGNRAGSRGGFPLAVFEDLLLLACLLEMPLEHALRDTRETARSSPDLHSVRTMGGRAFSLI